MRLITSNYLVGTTYYFSIKMTWCEDRSAESLSKMNSFSLGTFSAVNLELVHSGVTRLLHDWCRHVPVLSRERVDGEVKVKLY